MIHVITGPVLDVETYVSGATTPVFADLMVNTSCLLISAAA